MTEKHVQACRVTSHPITGAQDLKLWAGKGTGTRCLQCGLAIAAVDIEYEVEIDSSSAMTFHVRCFDEWRATHVLRNGVSVSDFPAR